MKAKLILSCEHGGNQIPEAYVEYFRGKQALLESHRGWDIGALGIYNEFKESKQFHHAQSSEISRLLVELNRSPYHPHLFSEVSKDFSRDQKQEILDEYYFPYRNQLASVISKLIQDGQQVIHLSVHTFTPILGEEIRNADIGLLYDPSSKLEKELCKAWKVKLEESSSKSLKIRMNYPYLGKADGLTTYLRKQFSKGYAGIELEVNNRIAIDPRSEILIEQLVESYSEVIENIG